MSDPLRPGGPRGQGLGGPRRIPPAAHPLCRRALALAVSAASPRAPSGACRAPSRECARASRWAGPEKNALKKNVFCDRPEEQKQRKPARPHRKLAKEILDQRITKLTKRLERFKSQHEATRITLTRYAHERFYREEEAITTPRARPRPLWRPSKSKKTQSKPLRRQDLHGHTPVFITREPAGACI
jgi:hypothetical protein